MKFPSLSPLQFILCGALLIVIAGLALAFLGDKSAAIVGFVTTLFGLLLQLKPQTSPEKPEELTKENGESQ